VYLVRRAGKKVLFKSVRAVQAGSKGDVVFRLLYCVRLYSLTCLVRK
jgi:hypothetical protein